MLAKGKREERRMHSHRLQGNLREAETLSGIDSSVEKNSSPDNPGSDSPGLLATINPGSLEWLSGRKWRAQVTGTNVSPLGYGFGQGPAGWELVEPAAVGWAVRNRLVDLGPVLGSQGVLALQGQPLGKDPSGSGLWLKIQGERGKKRGDEAGLCLQLTCGHQETLPPSLAPCRKEKTQGKLWVMFFGGSFGWMGCEEGAGGCQRGVLALQGQHWGWEGISPSLGWG